MRPSFQHRAFQVGIPGGIMHVNQKSLETDTSQWREMIPEELPRAPHSGGPWCTKMLSALALPTKRAARLQPRLPPQHPQWESRDVHSPPFLKRCDQGLSLSPGTTCKWLLTDSQTTFQNSPPGTGGVVWQKMLGFSRPSGPGCPCLILLLVLGATGFEWDSATHGALPSLFSLTSTIAC